MYRQYRRGLALTKRILVTGGTGFIGSAVIRHITQETQDVAIVVDKLTYAGDLVSLEPVAQNPRFTFEKVDTCDRASFDRVFQYYRPDCVAHLAVKSHVDRSIDGPTASIEANIVETYTLLEATRAYWGDLSSEKRSASHLHHISTDEVYGDLHSADDFFTETTPYVPSSPYSVSKASSDHLVRAWLCTYGLSTLITNCSNSHGPCRFPEKLIPLMILNALVGKLLPVYDNGQQVRDWLYVGDHVRALYCVATTSAVGEAYNIDGHNEHKNLEVVETVCSLLEKLAPQKPQGIAQYRDLIASVDGRPGHDLRYVIDASKIMRKLGWMSQGTFESGMRKTVQQYLASQAWWKPVQDGSYQSERLGLKG